MRRAFAQYWFGASRLTDHAMPRPLEECIALAAHPDRGLESKALARLGRIGLEQAVRTSEKFAG